MIETPFETPFETLFKMLVKTAKPNIILNKPKDKTILEDISLKDWAFLRTEFPEKLNKKLKP
jgi:hypothetical protein